MTLDCYNRMDYHFQGRHPPPQLTAMVATQNSQYMSSQGTSSHTWLVDSGCNAHVTADIILEILQFRTSIMVRRI